MMETPFVSDVDGQVMAQHVTAVRRQLVAQPTTGAMTGLLQEPVLDGQPAVVNHLPDPQSGGRPLPWLPQVEMPARGHHRRAAAVCDSLTGLTSSQAVDTVMQQILGSVALVIPSEAGCIILFEHDRGRIAYARGFTPAAIAFFRDYYFALDELVPAGVIAKAKPYLVPDTELWPDWIPLAVSAWIRSSIGVPIVLRGYVIGLLVLDSATPHHFQPADVDKLQAFVQGASLALDNAYHLSQLEDQIAARTTELQAAKEQVEAIWDHSPDAILLLQPDLQIKHTNPAFTALFGSHAQRSLLALLHPADTAAVTALIQTMTDQQTRPHLEIQAYGTDGTLVDVELSLGPVTANGLVCILRDITERKRAQRALAEERNLLRTLIDAIPITIYVKDRQHRFVLHNNNPTYSLCGLAPQQVIGKTDFDFFPQAVAETFRCEEEMIFQTAQPLLRHELPLTREDGSVIWLSVTKVPLRNLQGEISGLAGFYYDITERKQNEAALQNNLHKAQELSELRSRFVSMASHEFRSPLTSILLMTETLRAYRAKLTEAQMDQRLQTIVEQVVHLKAIIDDVLELARMHAANVEFKPMPLDLDALCRNVIEEFIAQTTDAPQVYYQCNTAVPLVHFDKRLIRQAITNLVANAIKYSPSTAPVSVTLTCTDAALVIQVKDEGIGIPAVELAYLFQPFYRASNVSGIQGTGLGLVITKEAVELHGGSISVVSELGAGTTFTLTLPTDRASHG